MVVLNVCVGLLSYLTLHRSTHTLLHNIHSTGNTATYSTFLHDQTLSDTCVSRGPPAASRAPQPPTPLSL